MFESYLPSAQVAKLSAFFSRHSAKSVYYFWLSSLTDETRFHRECCYFWRVFLARGHSSRCETGASFCVQKLPTQFAAAKQIWVQTSVCVCLSGTQWRPFTGNNTAIGLHRTDFRQPMLSGAERYIL